MEIWILNWITLAIACVIFHQKTKQGVVADLLRNKSDSALLEMDEEAIKQLLWQAREKVFDTWIVGMDLPPMLIPAALSIVIPFLWTIMWAAWSIFKRFRQWSEQNKKVKTPKQFLRLQQQEINRRGLVDDKSISSARMTGNEGIDKGLSLSN